MPTLCPACFRPPRTCVCSAVRPFDPGLDVVILMHPKEAKNQRTGTGRLAHLCLHGSRVLSGVDFSADPRVEALANDPEAFPVVLYPGPDALLLDDLEAALRRTGRRLRLFALDGTWIAARKMMKLSPNLAALPRLSLRPAGPSRFALKRQPHPWCLSTIEALHSALDSLAGRGLADPGGRRGVLLEVLDAAVEAQRRAASEEGLCGRRQGTRRPVRPAPPGPSAKNRRRIGFPEGEE